MKYFAIVKHHSVVSRWEEIDANTLTSAKRKATKDYGNGHIGHVIHLVECKPENEDWLNDIPPWTKTIGEDKWHAAKW